jgi:predicted phage terminase large subunit-like protein
MVRRAAALRLPDAILPIDPYLLGVWLGDGTTATGAITSGEADRPWMRAEVERLGYRTTDRVARGLFGVANIRGALVKLSVLHDPAHGVVGGKHIPAVYMRSSIAQRRALLQGLIDTDGTVQPNGMVAFCSTNARLASGVAELVRTLGAKASIGEGRAMLNGKDCGPYWRVYFYLKGAARMPRKAQRTRDGYRTPNTYLTVTPAGRADTVCIEVDSPSHLFLCGTSMTPTHNSTYASILFPPWFLGRNPKRSIIGASHAGELAERFGRRVRNLVGSGEFRRVFGFGLSGDNAAAGRWETERGGEYYAVGVDASVTGRRADLGIIDDPVKGRAEADSASISQRVWDWYKADFWPRLKPGGRIVIILTRWSDHDLAGRLLAEQEVGGEQWEVLSLPAEAGEDDPLGRAPGELLWPEWFTPQMFAEAKRDTRNWSALYQQQPVPDTGDYFKAEWIRWYDHQPDIRTLRTYGASDYAVTSAGGDYTVHGVIGVDPSDNIYLLDWWRGQTDSEAWVEAFLDLMEQWSTLMWGEEQGQIIRSLGPFIVKRQMERRIYGYRRQYVSANDKQTRAQGIRARLSMGKVYFPKRATWATDLVSEMLRFPAGKHDDQVDVLSLFGRMLGSLMHGDELPERVEPIRGLPEMTFGELDAWQRKRDGVRGARPQRIG